MKNVKDYLGNSKEVGFDDGDKIISEETQTLFDDLVHLLAEYEQTTGRTVVMNLGIYSRDRKRGTSATYAHMSDAGYCDHCEELHAFPNIVPGSDLDPLVSTHNGDEVAELMLNATEKQMYTDPFDQKYLVFRGVLVRRVDENNWEQIPPRDGEGKEYPEFLEGKMTNAFQQQTEATNDADFDVALDGKVVSAGTKTLN